MYLPILTYHRILTEPSTKIVDPQRIGVSADQFRRHLRWLRRLGYRTVSLAEYGQRLRQDQAFPRRSFAITFDDGYAELISLALPILKEFGFTATVFAVSQYLYATNAWDDGQARLMSAEDLRQWHWAGMEVGAHTCTHVHLPQVDADTARREMEDSKKKLEEILKVPVRTLAYPYGESNAQIERLAEDAGFEAAFATDRAPRVHSENLYRLRRSVVFPRNTVWEILLKVQPWYPAYQDRKRGR